MIKRVIGILATLAILAVVVFVALNYGNYNTMLPADLFSPKMTASEVVEDIVSEPEVEAMATDADVEAEAEVTADMVEESVE